jgi:hypothetical protein
MFNYFFSENRVVYEKMWKNIVQSERPRMKIERMRIACRIPKATDRHSEYVIRFVFSPQHWFHIGLTAL